MPYIISPLAQVCLNKIGRNKSVLDNGNTEAFLETANPAILNGVKSEKWC